jgi:hypothetical protein
MLETNTVFIDTHVFVAKGFHFSNESMKTIQKLGENGDLDLITTVVTVREVEANIREKIQEELAHISKAKIVRRLPGVEATIQQIPSVESASQVLIDQFKTFLRVSNTTILEISNEIAGSVFDKYFECKPPFGPGKKKCEFPDAFVVGTILEYIDEGKCYIVSGDSDFSGACSDNSNLIEIAKIEQLLDLFNEHLNVVKERVTEVVESSKELLSSELGLAIEHGGLSCGDSDDGLRTDFEIISFSLLNFSVEDINILDVLSDRAVVSIDVSSTLKVSYTYDNYECAIYDKEDGKYYNVESEDKESEIEFEAICSFTVFFPEEEGGEYQIDDFDIDEPDALDITDRL